MVQSVIASNVQGNINALIQQVFGGPNIDLTITDQIPMSVSTHDGEEKSVLDANGNITAASIRLNQAVLVNSSQEFIPLYLPQYQAQFNTIFRAHTGPFNGINLRARL